MSDSFDVGCVACPCLSQSLANLRRQYPHYDHFPVAPFGVEKRHLLVVGLVPGLHGANATARPFTGDQSGLLLYETLYKFGFASMPISEAAGDGLELVECSITNAVKCSPPQK